MSPRPRPWRPLGLVLGVSASFMATTGCAVLPIPRAQPVTAAPDSYSVKASFSAPERAWPSDEWWRDFKDPQLIALIEEGLAQAPDLRVAAERFLRANAVARQVASRQSPDLSANGQVGGAKQSYNYIFPSAFAPRGWKDFGQATLDLTWELDFWGKTRAAAAAAHNDAQAAAAEAAEARLILSTGVAAAYADLARLYAELDAAKSAVEVRRRTAGLIGGRFAKGLENDGAVERADSSAAAAEADVARLTEELDLRRNQIAMLIGAGPDRGRTIERPAPLAIAAFGLPKTLPLDLIGRRPDVIAAKFRVEAAARRIKAARASFYPNLNLSASAGVQALGVGNLVKSGSDFGSAGPALSLPIFDGGLLQGQYRSAEADYGIAVAQYDAQVTQALREVSDAATSARALSTRLERTQDSARHAEAAWRSAENRYRGGLATYLDVLTAEDALIQSRQAVAALVTRSFALDISLTRALGGGFRQ